MLAIVAATAIATHISPDTIYTLKLRRRGIDLQRRTRPLLADLCVSDAMSPTPAPIAGAAVLQDVLNRFAEAAETVLPVTDTGHRLLGVISATDIEAAMQQPVASVTAAELASTAPLIRPGDPLDDAIQALGHADDDGLPVVDRRDGSVVGWINHHDVMATYRRRLAEAPSTRRSERPDRSK
jgi:CIC family chloride channel protein